MVTCTSSFAVSVASGATLRLTPLSAIATVADDTARIASVGMIKAARTSLDMGTDSFLFDGLHAAPVAADRATHHNAASPPEVSPMSAKVFAHLRRASATGAAESGKAPGILDRPQQAVVGLLHRGLESGPGQGRDHEGGNPATGGIRAAPGVGASLVPGYEQNAVAAVRGRIEDGGNLPAEPCISGCDRAVVHVVAHVRRDEDVVRHGSVGEVGG